MRRRSRFATRNRTQIMYINFHMEDVAGVVSDLARILFEHGRIEDLRTTYTFLQQRYRRRRRRPRGSNSN